MKTNFEKWIDAVICSQEILESFTEQDLQIMPNISLEHEVYSGILVVAEYLGVKPQIKSITVRRKTKDGSSVEDVRQKLAVVKVKNHELRFIQKDTRPIDDGYEYATEYQGYRWR